MGKIKKSQLAIGNYHYISYSMDYFLNSVSEIGVENIEIWGAKPHFCVDDQDDYSVSELRKKVSDLGLNIICFCPEQNTYPVDITCKEERLRSRSIYYMKRAIELASKMDAKRMLVCPGNGYIDEPFEAMWSRCLSSLLEITKTAADYGICLMLETQSQEESVFMNTVHHQKKMIDEVNHPNMKAMLDTVQLSQFDHSVAEDIKKLGQDAVQHVHLGNTLVQDRNYYDKQLPEHLCLGRKVTGHIGFREGNLPMKQYFAELEQCNYDKYITVEICQRAYFIDAHRYAKEAIDYITKIVEK